ncbi:MAG: UDP-N-acetylmuramate dehydrogenase [Candidatus Omnitrophica bacterium]|nr:UDP-N-acetylmuramate dehydrogenase [Candidatus Omnitrophota bacterium]MDD5429379.1 UDP-N-acetylmuramate dehydrogenase [Candidatus Omnitrophota bacterium]
MPLKKIELKRKVELGSYTSLKIGGTAKYFFVVENADELRLVLNDIGGDFYLLGGGSNLLIKNGLISKPVIKLGEGFKFIEKKSGYFRVGSSTKLSFLIKYCIENSLGGLQQLIGIPAEIGGLLNMNASSFGRGISSCLKSVAIADKKGKLGVFSKEEIFFGYRTSSLSEFIILSGDFILSKENNIKEQSGKFLKKKIGSQDFSFPSCGCIFKNPCGDFSAGALIDSCGFKGLAKGQAAVSEKHANFILNLGGATYQQVDYLINKIKETVYKSRGLLLEEEIIRWL